MSREFEGKVVIVTGASSGIAAAAVTCFAAEGAIAIGFARRELAPEGAAAMIAGDVTSPADVDRLFEVVESKWGACDVLVNCAGSIEPVPLVSMPDEVWDRTFDVNVRALFLTSRRALPKMIERRTGWIVNVASISGVPGPQKFPGFTAYCAAKGAAISFTEALAAEVKEHGIRVNCVSPGSVATPMLRQANPALVPDMTSHEVADAILFLASDRSRPMNGQNLHVFSS